PRSAFYNTAPQAANDYSSNVTMWSRNAKPSSSKVIGQEVKPSRWADGGHDTSMISKIGNKDTVPPTTTAPAAPTPEPSKPDITMLYPPYATNQAAKFSGAVINARNSKAFITPSQLVQLRDSSNAAYFGNTAQSTSAPVPAEWRDAGAEEYLARIFDLASVRSRNFRVFVTGQYVDPRPPYSSSNPHVLSTVKKVYQVFLHPTRAANGSIQSQVIDL